MTGFSSIDDPDHEYRYLDASGQWEGGTTRDSQVRLGRMSSNSIVPGMSGAPVRQLLRDDVACGVVSGRFNTADGWLRDAVWVARTEDLQPLLTGIANVVMETQAPIDTRKRLNPKYLAELIRNGPFTGTLPRGLSLVAIENTLVADATAVHRIDAVHLALQPSGNAGPDGADGYIECYASPTDALARAQARFSQLRKQYSKFGVAQGDPREFCVLGNGEWICGGQAGYVYVEASVYPGGNAFLPFASGVVSAALQYVNQQSVIAAG